MEDAMPDTQSLQCCLMVQPFRDILSFEFFHAPAFFQEMRVFLLILGCPLAGLLIIAAKRNLEIDPTSEFLDFVRLEADPEMALREHRK